MNRWRLRQGGKTVLMCLLCVLAVQVTSFPQAQTRQGTSGVQLLTSGNIPPQVEILFPPEGKKPQGTVFHIAADVQVRARAYDTDGLIKEVRFYVSGELGTNLIAVVTNAPYETICRPAQRTADFQHGSQVFTAVAVDNQGATTTSAPAYTSFRVNVGSDFFLLEGTDGHPLVGYYVRVAPATFTFQAELFDSDGIGNPVDFYLGTNKVGTLIDPPYRFTVANLARGEYPLQIATTNVLGKYVFFPGDLFTGVSVIDPSFRKPVRADACTFTFDFTGTLPHATNILEQSTDLTTWLPIATNVTTTNVFSFRDTNATESLRFYRIKLFTAEPLLP